MDEGRGKQSRVKTLEISALFFFGVSANNALVFCQDHLLPRVELC